MKNKPIYHLTMYIVMSAILVFLIGLIIKFAVAHNSPLLKDTPTIAIPFAVMQDKSLLNSNSDKPDSPLGAAGGLTHTLPEKAEDETPAQPQTREFEAVDDSYFDDALFIGDSRTVGLSQYARLGNADYFASVGLSVFKVFSTTVSDNNFGSTDLASLLSSKSYGKIYLMLGINEIGYPSSTLYPQMESVINQIRELQPDALLFLMGNLRVSASMAAAHSYFSVSNIDAFNNYIASFADDISVFYFDVNPLFCDDSGYLRADLSGDGCHLYASCYPEWADFIKLHGIVISDDSAETNPITGTPDDGESADGENTDGAVTDASPDTQQ